MTKTTRITSIVSLLAFYVLLLLNLSIANAADTGATIVSFSRHTFRGITQQVAPQQISLKKYGIDIKVPLLSYAENATPRGLDIAKNFAGKGLQQAAALAVEALGEHKKFDGRWDEFRADLATERTFWTALKLREGLKHHQPSIALTGCTTKPGEAIDIVSARDPVMKCLRSSRFDLSSDLAIFKNRSETFLKEVRVAIDAKGTFPSLPDLDNVKHKEELPAEYAEVAKLSSAVEMSAALGAPLPQLFKTVNKQMLLTHGESVLSTGVNALGIRFFIKNPLPIADQIALPSLTYIATRAAGSRTAIFTHDDYISSLIHSLGFINNASAPNELAIYPLETIVFAFGDENVSVTRMRPTIQHDGYMPGSYTSAVLWKGSREAWDQKVKEIKQRASDAAIDKEARACLEALRTCAPETLDVNTHR